MTVPQPTLKYSELTERIIGIFYDVYNELGYGLLESTYSFGSRPQFRRLLFDNERKKIRDNPFESVAKVLA